MTVIVSDMFKDSRCSFEIRTAKIEHVGDVNEASLFIISHCIYPLLLQFSLGLTLNKAGQSRMLLKSSHRCSRPLNLDCESLEKGLCFDSLYALYMYENCIV